MEAAEIVPSENKSSRGKARRSKTKPRVTGCCRRSPDKETWSTTQCGLCAVSFHWRCLGLRCRTNQLTAGAFVCGVCIENARSSRLRVIQLEKLLIDATTKDGKENGVAVHSRSKYRLTDSDYNVDPLTGTTNKSAASLQPRNVSRKSCSHPADQSPNVRGQSNVSTERSKNSARKSCTDPERQAPVAPANQSTNHARQKINTARKSCSHPENQAMPKNVLGRKRCKLCSAHFPDRCQLRRHVRREHVRSERRLSVYCCKKCGVDFDNRYMLHRHLWRDHVGAFDAADVAPAGELLQSDSEHGAKVSEIPTESSNFCAHDQSVPSQEHESEIFKSLNSNQADESEFIHRIGTPVKMETLSLPQNSNMEGTVESGALHDTSRPMTPLNCSRQYSNDDNYLYCGECKEEFMGDCPFHGPMYRIEDSVVSDDDPLRADHSIPSIFTIAPSGLANAGLGVWANVDVPQRTLIGPYRGKIVDVKSHEALTSEYVWEIKKDKKTVHCVDGKEIAFSNWMRYINCANHNEEQNMTAFQYKGEIYYRTIHPIAKNTELLVWYGSQYARVLGLMPAKKQGDGTKKRKVVDPKDYVECKLCGLRFSTEGYLRRHAAYKHDNKENGEPTTLSGNMADVDNKENGNSTTISGNMADVEKQPTSYETSGQTESSELVVTLAGNHRKQKFHRSLLHTDEVPRPFNCHRCGTAYKQLSHLTEHEFHTHGITIVYGCRECPYRFDFYRDLANHRKTSGHKGVDRLRLGSQDDVISKSILLGTESAVHDEFELPLMPREMRLRPHFCDFPNCNLSFKTIYCLRKHQANAHGIIVIYTCKQCLQEFKVFVELRAHQANFAHKGSLRRIVGTEQNVTSEELCLASNADSGK